MPPQVDISFTLNGRPTSLRVPADMSTLTMLRDILDMTGSKLACGEGECGACTIIADDVSLNACLMYAADCDGRDIVTIEGIRTGDELDATQQAFVDHGAIQCGYCIPGMIVQATYLERSNGKMSRDELRRGLEGNVCRCTGYKKIFDAVASISGSEQ